MIWAPTQLIRLGRAGFVFAREGVFGIVDPAMVPVPARPLLRFARLFERRSTGDGGNAIVSGADTAGPELCETWTVFSDAA